MTAFALMALLVWAHRPELGGLGAYLRRRRGLMPANRAADRSWQRFLIAAVLLVGLTGMIVFGGRWPERGFYALFAGWLLALAATMLAYLDLPGDSRGRRRPPVT